MVVGGRVAGIEPRCLVEVRDRLGRTAFAQQQFRCDELWD